MELNILCSRSAPEDTAEDYGVDIANHVHLGCKLLCYSYFLAKPVF
jgi:hypothetical protein